MIYDFTGKVHSSPVPHLESDVRPRWHSRTTSLFWMPRTTLQVLAAAIWVRRYRGESI